MHRRTGDVEECEAGGGAMLQSPGAGCSAAFHSPSSSSFSSHHASPNMSFPFPPAGGGHTASVRLDCCLPLSQYLPGTEGMR